MVRIGEYCSSIKSVNFGVPQGSILGPSLFLVYINDLCNLNLLNGSIVSFADDTTLLFHGKTWEEAAVTAEYGLRVVMRWLRSNLLTLNVNKTQYMCFSILNPSRTLPSFLEIRAHTCLPEDASCSCMVLDRTNVVKYLGVQVDCQLNWQHHIRVLAGRIRKLIVIFKKLRHAADYPLLRRIYYALCQSLLGYCVVAWGGTYKTSMLKVERAQRSVLKVMTFKSFREPTHKLFKDCEVLSVRQLYILNAVLAQHSKTIYDPQLKTIKRRHDIICRTQSFNTIFTNRFFCFLGPYIYNKLNSSLSLYPNSRAVAKKILQKWLINRTYQETEDLLVVVT